MSKKQFVFVPFGDKFCVRYDITSNEHGRISLNPPPYFESTLHARFGFGPALTFEELQALRDSLNIFIDKHEEDQKNLQEKVKQQKLTDLQKQREHISNVLDNLENEIKELTNSVFKPKTDIVA